MKGSKKIKILLLVSTSFCLPLLANAEVSLLNKGDSEGWLNPNEAIKLSLDNSSSSPRVNDLAFFIGTMDVSSFFRRSADGSFVYDANALALPIGTNTLKVYDKTDSQSEWIELGSVELKVLSKSGFSVSKISPKVNLNIVAKLTDHRSGDVDGLLNNGAAEEPADKTFSDIDTSIIFESEHKRSDGLEITSNTNIVSTSHREAALRYEEKQNKAPKVDLSEYIVTAVKGKTKVQLGHISQGNHPLLVDNLSNRGLIVQHQINDRLSVGLSSQSGREITGYNDILGFTTKKSIISTFTVGIELLKRVGAAKLELSYLKGRTLGDNNFDEGQVATAEDSSGYGLRLLTSNESGKLTTDLAYARSKYTNPTEDTPEFNGEKLVDVKATTNNAYYISVGYQLLSDKKLSNKITADLSVNLRYAQTDSEYKSLAATPNPDERLKEIGLSGRVGLVELQLKHSRSRDNLENINSILTTQTNTTELGLTTSLKELFGVGEDQKPSTLNKLLPNLSFTAQKVRQYALNSPKTEDSDFNDNSHLPNQVNLSLNNSLEWELDKWSLGYQTEWSDQDNRQTGREKADFNTLGHQVSVTLRPKESVTLGLSVGRVRSRDNEQSTKRYDNTYGINLDWKINQKFALSLAHSKNKSDDNVNIEETLSTNSQVKLSYQFNMPVPEGKKLPGQAFIRYVTQDASSSNKEQNFSTDANNSAIFAGINFSF